MAERWVKLAAAPDESVALLMDGVLKDAGIPSLIQRAAGFDAPDFLAAGPRDVLEHFSRWLIGQPVTTVRKPAQSVPLADGIERLRYGFHQGLLRASLDAA